MSYTSLPVEGAGGILSKFDFPCFPLPPSPPAPPWDMKIICLPDSRSNSIASIVKLNAGKPGVPFDPLSPKLTPSAPFGA